MSMLYKKEVLYRCEQCGRKYDLHKKAINCFYTDIQNKYLDRVDFVLKKGRVFNYGYGSEPNYIYDNEVFRSHSLQECINYIKDNHLREGELRFEIDGEDDEMYYSHIEDIVDIE